MEAIPSYKKGSVGGKKNMNNFVMILSTTVTEISLRDLELKNHLLIVYSFIGLFQSMVPTLWEIDCFLRFLFCLISFRHGMVHGLL